MLYIHRTSCISPQHSFVNVDIQQLNASVNNKLHVIEPVYEGIPPGLLRRMGKAVRIGVGAALPLIRERSMPDGIIIGTANGGMEDCIKFLNQIIEYSEGMLTPGNFVQSTPNAIASQVSLMTGNKNYNITHVHRGLAFENALIDALMHARENPSAIYLIGGVDEISAYNYNIDYLDGWYKKESISNSSLYESNSPASIAGEGAAMFLVGGKPENAIAAIQNIQTLHAENEEQIAEQLKNFLTENLNPGEKIDLFISGENGDNRLQHFYDRNEKIFQPDIPIARFKHMSGEYPTASAFAIWLACEVLRSQVLPQHMIKKISTQKEFKKILIYNNYKGAQHSMMLVSKI